MFSPIGSRAMSSLFAGISGIGIADWQAAQDRQFRGDSQLRADELGVP